MVKGPVLPSDGSPASLVLEVPVEAREGSTHRMTSMVRSVQSNSPVLRALVLQEERALFHSKLRQVLVVERLLQSNRRRGGHRRVDTRETEGGSSGTPDSERGSVGGGGHNDASRLA